MTRARDEAREREHEAFADWDAAYVLGALPPVERRAYEDHVAGCARCRAALVELAPLPGLLARAPHPTAPDEPSRPPRVAVEPSVPPRVAVEPSLLPRVADASRGPSRGASSSGPTPRGPSTEEPHDASDGRRGARRRERRHRRPRRGLLAGLVALVVVGLAVAVPVVMSRMTTPSAAPGRTVTLARQTDTTLAASVTLTPVAWGTRLSMVCDYPPAPAASPGPAGSAPSSGSSGSSGSALRPWPTGSSVSSGPSGSSWPVSSAPTTAATYPAPSGATAAEYALVVTDADGRTSQVSTWSARPGATVRLDAATAVPIGRIAAVEIRSDAGDTLLAANLTSG